MISITAAHQIHVSVKQAAAAKDAPLCAHIAENIRASAAGLSTLAPQHFHTAAAVFDDDLPTLSAEFTGGTDSAGWALYIALLDAAAGFAETAIAAHGEAHPDVFSAAVNAADYYVEAIELAHDARILPHLGE